MNPQRDQGDAQTEFLGVQRPGGHGEQVVVRDAKFLVA
jgi:hypothetical protein